MKFRSLLSIRPSSNVCRIAKVRNHLNREEARPVADTPFVEAQNRSEEMQQSDTSVTAVQRVSANR